jgi:hypothetical protein
MQRRFALAQDAKRKAIKRAQDAKRKAIERAV